MPKTDPVTIEKLAEYPRMVPWFSPGLLAKLLWRVIVSDLFGQYADRRLIVAALDKETDDDLVDAAKKFAPERDDNEHVWKFSPDADGAVWFDFVADLGDGFDATYAIATLLVSETLTLGNLQTKRGQLLIMGGDEVYPHASAEAYQKQLRDPYDWAFPDPNPGLLKGPPVYAIPGNHDWYDGLVIFLALFSRKQHLHLGGWRTHQRRSYFALQITPEWWVWAMDAQLDDDVDQPQKDYFATIAKGMPDHANIILCGPEPGWLYTTQKNNKSLGVIDYVAWIGVNRKKGLKIPLVLSGDTHHYSRYEGDDKPATQFITSGGGGAFLHPTHQLQATIDIDREKDGYQWLGGRVKTLKLGSDPAQPAGDDPISAVYPGRNESIAMLKGNAAFVKYNPAFAMLLGVFYWALGLVTLHLWWDVVYIAPLTFLAGFWAYTKKQEGGGRKVFLVSLANAAAHSVAVIGLAFLFEWANVRLSFISLTAESWSQTIVETVMNIGAAWDFPRWGNAAQLVSSFVVSDIIPRVAFLLFAAEMIVLGGAVAGTLFGAYLYISSRWFNMNHNDAFSSMRLDSYRNFLRIRITDNELTIYPIGLDSVPQRDAWRRNKKAGSNNQPEYVPETPLKPHLIEGPIVIKPHKQGSV